MLLLLSSLSLLQSCKSRVYLNITTKEENKITVKLTAAGFQVVGEDHDLDDGREGKEEDVFETPYSLLNKISPGFTLAFGGGLQSRLEELRSAQEQEQQQQQQ